VLASLPRDESDWADDADPTVDLGFVADHGFTPCTIEA
jgi:hypothetical protein